VSTHANTFTTYLVWDTIQSHHKLQHSEAYEPFVHSLFPLLAGELDIAHVDIGCCGGKQLKLALESPVTQTSVLYIKKDSYAKYLKTFKEVSAKYLEGKKNKGYYKGYSYEEP